MKLIKPIFKIIITIISIIFLIWFILPVFYYRVLNPGNMLGILICLLLLFRFTFAKAYNSLKRRFYAEKVSRIIFKALIVCASIFAIYAVVISGFIAYFGMSASPKNSTATAVVLGAQVKPWGPSSLLWQRINAAESYLNNNPEAKAVVSGGKGDDEPMSEAKSMYDNIKIADKSRIYQEDKSTNTKQNIANSFKIIKEYGLNENIAIITDSYHQFRARLIARKAGIKTEISSVSTKNNRVGIICYPTFFVREWLAIPIELIK